MDTLPPDIQRALRRSRVRRDLLLALAEHGATYPHQLARLVRVDNRRLRDVLHGREPAYRTRASPVALQLVRTRGSAHGDVISVTRRGAEVAEYMQRRGGRV